MAARTSSSVTPPVSAFNASWTMPDPRAAGSLISRGTCAERSASWASVIPVPFGLGRATGLVRYNWANAQPGGALHSFGAIVKPRSGEVITPVAHHECVCYRLDDLVKLPDLPFPTHIKIDVDGGELEVLAGAPDVMRDPRCRALQVEVIDVDAARARSREVTELLAAAGFSLVGEHAHALARVRDLQFARI